jgi:hypothetical protein
MFPVLQKQNFRRNSVLKRLSVLAALLCLFTVSAGWAQELATRMGNKEVIEMVGLGLSDDVIVEKIRTVPETKFDTGLDALKELKAAKVPDAVIKAMINPRAPVVVQAAVAPAAAPAVVAEDPNLPPKEVGVYWKDTEKFVFIEGQMVSQAQIGGRAAHYFTYGVKSKHWNAYLSGNESRNRVKDNKPVFYFYVPEGNSGNDYTLLKLDKKGDRRQFEVEVDLGLLVLRQHHGPRLAVGEAGNDVFRCKNLWKDLIDGGGGNDKASADTQDVLTEIELRS